jgi:hypothetical protein
MILLFFIHTLRKIWYFLGNTWASAGYCMPDSMFYFLNLFFLPTLKSMHANNLHIWCIWLGHDMFSFILLYIIYAYRWIIKFLKYLVLYSILMQFLVFFFCNSLLTSRHVYNLIAYFPSWFYLAYVSHCLCTKNSMYFLFWLDYIKCLYMGYVQKKDCTNSMYFLFWLDYIE